MRCKNTILRTNVIQKIAIQLEKVMKSLEKEIFFQQKIAIPKKIPTFATLFMSAIED